MLNTRTCASVLAIVALVLLIPRQAPAATLAVATTSNPPVDFEPWSVGWRFQALQDIDVLSLGYWDYLEDGYTSIVNVGIWTDSGTLLGSLGVPAGTSPPLIDGYRFADLTTPVSLSTGEYYRIAASGSFDDFQFMTAASFTESAAVNYDTGYLLQNVNTLAFPTDPGPSGAFFGPNFLYVVPEPSTLVLAALGMIGVGAMRWRRRR